MSRTQNVLLLIVGSVAALLLGSSFLVLTIEHAAASLTWVGIYHPVTAWTVVGAILGGYVGMLYGRYRSGTSPTVYGAGGGGLLLIGLLAVPMLRYGMAPAPTPEPEIARVAYSAYITAQTLNVRAAPVVRDGNVVGTVDCGAEVRVISGDGSPGGDEWLHIANAQGIPWGYVAQQYTKRRSAGNRPDCRSPQAPAVPSGPVADGRTSAPNPSTETAGSDNEEPPERARETRATERPSPTSARANPEPSPPQPTDGDSDETARTEETSDARSSGISQFRRVQRPPESDGSQPDPQPEANAPPSSASAQADAEDRAVPPAARPSAELEDETEPEPRARSRTRSLSPRTKQTLEFEIRVSRGLVRPTATGSEIELTVRQTSTDFEGTWYPWAFIVRNCTLVDDGGRRFRVVPQRSAGPEASRAAVGSSRTGTVVFQGPSVPPGETTFAFTFGYYVDKDLDFTLRLPN